MTWCPEELQVVTSPCSLQVEVVMEVVLRLIMYSLPFTYKPPKVSSGGKGGSFPGGSAVKKPPANAGDVGSTPGLGRSPGGGNGNPRQYSCLENPMDGG